MHHVENAVESGIIHIDKALDNVGLEVKYSNELVQVVALRFRGRRGEVASLGYRPCVALMPHRLRIDALGCFWLPDCLGTGH